MPLSPARMGTCANIISQLLTWLVKFCLSNFEYPDKIIDKLFIS